MALLLGGKDDPRPKGGGRERGKRTPEKREDMIAAFNAAAIWKRGGRLEGKSEVG